MTDKIVYSEELCIEMHEALKAWMVYAKSMRTMDGFEAINRTKSIFSKIEVK